MLRLFLVFLLGLGLVGCASLSKESCLEGDWYAIGLKDGSNGYKAERRFDHQAACTKHGVSAQLQVEEYLRGREEGLEEYCTPENAYDVGLRVEYHHNVCPQEMKAAFNKAWREGRREARIRCLADYHLELIHYRMHHYRMHRYHLSPLISSDCY